VKTNQVVATVPVGPAQSEGGIAASPDAIWLVTDPKGVLSRIDPATDKVAAEVAIAPNAAACIYGDGAIWVTTPEKNLLTRIDAKTNQVTATIEVGPQPRFLTVGGGSVWTLNQGDGTVSRVDAKSAKVLATIAVGVPGSGGEIAFGEGHIWATIFQIPIRNRPGHQPRNQQWFGAGGDSVRVGHGSVWLSNLREQNVWRFSLKQP
jgi:YVTN family beta-propeller protein